MSARTGGHLAVAGPVLTLAVMVWLHVAFPGAVSPMNGLISDYAWVDTAGPLFTLGVLSLATGTAGLTYALARVEPSRSAAARVLLAGVSVALVTATLFPTDPAPEVSSVSGEIHRWSAALVFTGLPGAGWILARQTSELSSWRRASRAINVVSAVSVLALVSFLLSHPGSPVGDLFGGPAFYGLVERGLVLAQIVLILTMASGAVASAAMASGVAPGSRLRGATEPEAGTGPFTPLAGRDRIGR